jgi:hypothetical protein
MEVERSTERGWVPNKSGIAGLFSLSGTVVENNLLTDALSTVEEHFKSKIPTTTHWP